ncbi:MAG: (d)CMP kinase [Pseudobdellovibrionaceae bacterium]
MSTHIIIAVDGPAASGKGTLARRLADQLHLAHLDTGALYRLTAKHILDIKGNPDDPKDALEAALYIRDHLNWEMLENPLLRTDKVADATSRSSQFPAMREVLLETQRNFAHHPPLKHGVPPHQGAVLDGRDIGTVVCPFATIKFFVTAGTETRAERRFRELGAKGITTTYDDVLLDMQERDARDASRTTAPLKPAADAVILDTSSINADEAFEKALSIVRNKIA